MVNNHAMEMNKSSNCGWMRTMLRRRMKNFHLLWWPRLVGIENSPSLFSDISKCLFTNKPSKIHPNRSSLFGFTRVIQSANHLISLRAVCVDKRQLNFFKDVKYFRPSMAQLGQTYWLLRMLSSWNIPPLGFILILQKMIEWGGWECMDEIGWVGVWRLRRLERQKRETISVWKDRRNQAYIIKDPRIERLRWVLCNAGSSPSFARTLKNHLTLGNTAPVFSSLSSFSIIW